MTSPTPPKREKMQSLLKAIEKEETMGELLCKVHCGEIELLRDLASYIRTLENEHQDMKEAFQKIQTGKMQIDNESDDVFRSMTMRFMEIAKTVLSYLTL